MKYSIREDRIEALERKLNKIAKKCAKYGCDFTYKRGDEHYEEIDVGMKEKAVVKFVDVEVEGNAVINGWTFVAGLEHTDKGNVIHGIGDVEVPSRYYACSPWCEHCKTDRARKETYIVFNGEEFKQVGGSCLRDYTHGWSAESVAFFESIWTDLEEEEKMGHSCGGYTRYIEVDFALKVIAETIRCFGYVKAQSEEISTATRAYDIIELLKGRRDANGSNYYRELKEEMGKRGFDAEKSADKVADAVAWCNAQSEDNNYFHNLKVVVGSEYVTGRNFGILASLFPAHDRKLAMDDERKAREQDEAKRAAQSTWVGNVGDRITFNVKSSRVITSWETAYGITCVYGFIDEDGHELTWKTSNYVNTDRTFKVVATVKELKEFRGIKQTEVTRCKVTYEEKPYKGNTVEEIFKTLESED